MRIDDRGKEKFDFEGWSVMLSSYRIGDSYLTEIESGSSGATIALATGITREEAETAALKEAKRRLLRVVGFDPALMVGG
jgi:hypothetical protein